MPLQSPPLAGGTPLRATLLLAAVLLAMSSCASLGALVDAPARTASRPEALPGEIVVLDAETHLRTYAAAHAEAYLHYPYAYGAKGPDRFDCSGFTSHVLREFDIALLGSSMSQAKQGTAVSVARAQPGDIVYFATASGRVNHVALVVANTPAGVEVVHATTSRGVVRDNISTSSYWAPRIAGARRVVDCRAGMASAY